MAGVDPRPFTLRQLGWMASGREQAEWLRAYRVVAQVAASGWAPRALSPADVVPDPYLPPALRPDPAAAENRARVENDLAWAALGEGLRRGVSGR